MQSSNDKLRNSVCTLITPIVIKINKNSLPYILSLVSSLILKVYSYCSRRQRGQAKLMP